MWLYIGAFSLLGFIFTLLVTPWVIKLAWKVGVVRYPPSYYLEQAKKKGVALDRFKLMTIKRRLEKPPTPEWGGISYIVGFLLLAAVGLLLSKDINLGAQFLSDYLWWGAAVIFLFIVNVLDDKYELPSTVLLASYVVATLMFVASDFRLTQVAVPFSGKLNMDIGTLVIRVFGLPIYINLWTDILLIPYILFMILAIKVQAGADSVMELNTLVALGWIAVLSYVSGQVTPAFLAAVLAGLLAGFTVFNWHPAKIWSGGAGDSTIGFIIATFSVIGRSNLSAILILFALPIVDWIYVLYRRAVRVLKTHKKIWLILKMSDKNHLHHRLMKMGLSEPQVAMLEAAVTFILGLILLVTPIDWRNELLIVVYLVTFLAMFYTERKAKQASVKAHKEEGIIS